MLGGLTKKKIRFVVIGGVAAAIHGSSRVTNDLDICYEAGDRANVAALARLLRPPLTAARRHSSATTSAESV